MGRLITRRQASCAAAIAAAIAAALALAPPSQGHAATADECLPPLRAALNVSTAGAPLVTLHINDGVVHLLLDTGAEETTLTQAAVERLGLKTDNSQAQTMTGVGGSVAIGTVRPNLVTAGGRALAGISFAVVPVMPPTADKQPIDGLLGADMLSAYEIDLDLGHHLIFLYDPSKCPTPTLPWTRTYDPIDAQFSKHRHLTFPALLDGQKVTGFIDTGAQFSLVDAAATQRLGVTEAALAEGETLDVQGISSNVVAARKHRFAKLGLGNNVVLSPVLAVTKLAFDDADVLIGTDVLARQRIWLSYKTRRIYIARPE